MMLAAKRKQLISNACDCHNKHKDTGRFTKLEINYIQRQRDRNQMLNNGIHHGETLNQDETL